MKNAVLLLFGTILIQSSAAQYVPVDSGSTIEFNVKHFGLKTTGSFTGLQGSITFDRKFLNDAKFDVSIDAGSIRTGVDIRDDHLRGEGWFESSKYQRIHFTSTKITSSEKSDELVISGQLTLKNHPKNISFPFTVTSTSSGYFFKGKFSLSRKDFDLGGSGVVSDNVDVILNIATIRQ